MDNYSEITASAETDFDHSAGFDPSVSQSKSSHFVTKSPAIYSKMGAISQILDQKSFFWNRDWVMTNQGGSHPG